MELIFRILEIVGNCLDGLLLILILRGPFRKYPILLAYAVIQLATSLIEAWIEWAYGNTSRLYSNWYYADEVAVSLVLFLTIIILTYRALEGAHMLIPAGKLLGGLVVMAVLLPFLIYHQNYFRPRWFAGASQILNFGGALMNMVLWTALLVNRRTDRQLLTVSAGLGVLVTATAISYGVRSIFSGVGTPAYFTLMFQLTHVAAFAILCWAFRPAAATASDSSGAVTAI
jgi:hypothetical protein